MALRDSLVKAVFGAEISKRLFGVGKENSDLTYTMDRFGTSYTTAGYLESYTRLVYACVSAIAEDVGDYDPIFYRVKGDQREAINAHPLLKLLNNPQPNDSDGLTMYELFEGTQSFIELQGECFWYLPYGQYTKQPKEIHILRPDKVGISIDDNGEVDGYYLKRGPGQDPIPFEVFEILHFKSFNPKNPYRGMGTVEAALDYIQTETSMTKYTRNFFANNAGLSGVLTVNGEVSKGAFRKFSNAWREKYQGVDNAGKVAIVRNSDSTFTKVGLGLNELDMKNLKDSTIEDVTMMFRVPKALLGLSNSQGLGRAEVEVLEYIFAKRVINKKLQRLDGMMQRAINRYFPADGLIADHANVIPADKEFMLAQRTAGVDRWMTRNEIRDEDGLDSQQGGDVLYNGINMIPLSDDTPATIASANSTGKDMRGLGFVRSKNGKILIVRTKKKDSQQQDEAIKDPRADTDPDYTRKETFRLRVERNQHVYARKYLRAVKPILKDQRAEVISHIQHLGAKKDLASLLFSISEANDIFEQKLYPYLVSMALEQGALALVFAGDTEHEFKMTDALAAAMKQSTGLMAENFNQATLDELTATLTEGVQDGESLGKLTNRVNDVYDGAEGYRAERIARTETQNASGDATIEAYQQTGYVISKKWFANPGACEFCDALDGTEVGLEEAFVDKGDTITGTDGGEYEVSYDDIEAADAHPNCSCTIVPVRE